MRSEPQVTISRHNRSQLRAQKLPGRRERELRMALGECLYHVLVFLPQHAAGPINQPPARAHQLGKGRQQLVLAANVHLEILGMKPISRVGIPAKRARTTAGGIDQDALRAAGEIGGRLERFGAGGGKYPDPDVMDAVPPGSLP